jgi:hypothetical protein
MSFYCCFYKLGFVTSVTSIFCSTLYHDHFPTSYLIFLAKHPHQVLILAWNNVDAQYLFARGPWLLKEPDTYCWTVRLYPEKLPILICFSKTFPYFHASIEMTVGVREGGWR